MGGGRRRVREWVTKLGIVERHLRGVMVYLEGCSICAARS